MIPPGLVYSLPNLPSSVTNFQGPVLFSREKLENINCIIDPNQDRGGLFLGDTISIKRVDYLIKNNIQAVLSCAPEAIYVHNDDPQVNVVSTKFISALDSLNYDISQHFQETYQFIQDSLNKKQNILVHCHAGVSRSAAVVIAYMMKKLGLNFQSSMEMVKSRRPRIRPNQKFREALKQYEEKITLNQFGGNLSEKQYKMMQQNNTYPDYPIITNSFTSAERLSLTPNQRISQSGDLYYKPKSDTIIPKIEKPAYQPSGLSITQILMKADIDKVSQSQLQQKLNEFNTKLQNQTNSLFGREQNIKKVVNNVNQFQYNPSSAPYHPTRSHQSVTSYPTTMYHRPLNSNPQRIQFKPVQVESVRSNMQKQMGANKSKTTVVQGGLPDSYKSIAGMITPQPSRYESRYQNRYN